MTEAKREALLAWTGHQQVIYRDTPTLLALRARGLMSEDACVTAASYTREAGQAARSGGASAVLAGA